MHAASYVKIPLHRLDGTIRAHAIIDSADADLAVHRWRLGSWGYAIRNVPRSGGGERTAMLHRVVLGLTFGDGIQVDHIDRDKLNCQRSNLRIATNALNHQNRPSNAGSSSRYRGVSWNRQRGKWRAQVMLNGVVHTLGRFDDEEEAARVAQAWRLAHMPFTVEDPSCPARVVVR